MSDDRYKARLDARVVAGAYAYEHPEDTSIPPQIKRGESVYNFHNEEVICQTCMFMEKSGRYKGLHYCGVGNAIGVKQTECSVEPSQPGCSWWLSKIPATKEELDKMHLELFGMPRNH